MVGLKRGIVKLLPHNPNWAGAFEKEKKLLMSRLGDFVVDIQHIGSTSIPRISAKPIIDISIGIKSMRATKRYIKLFECLGYELRKGQSKSSHFLFVKGPEEKRTHYVHLMKYNGLIWKNDLAFRDYLHKNKKKAQEYANLKISLAEKYPNNRAIYTKNKADFIQSVIRIARKIQ